MEESNQNYLEKVKEFGGENKQKLLILGVVLLVASVLLAGVLFLGQDSNRNTNLNTVEGTVTIASDEPVPNPSTVIGESTGATTEVIAYNQDDEVVATAIINEEGEYSFETEEEQVDVVVNIEGVNTSEGEIYTAGRRSVVTDSTATVDFEFLGFESTEVNNTDVLVAYRHQTSNGASVKQVGNLTQLQAISSSDLYASYELVRDIDAEDTKDWNYGSGFNPIGITDETVNGYNEYDFFQGEINGNGYTISNLYVDRADRAGFIAKNRGTVVNLHFEDADMTTQDSTGPTGVVASVNQGAIRNVSVVDSVAVGNEVGLIAGLNKGSAEIDKNGVIDQVYAEGEVQGNNSVLQLGGIAGKSTYTAQISNTQANVTLPEPEEDNPAINIGGVVGLVTDDGGLITQNQYNEETAPNAVGSTYEFNGTITNNEAVPESELQNNTLTPIATGS